MGTSAFLLAVLSEACSVGVITVWSTLGSDSGVLAAVYGVRSEVFVL